MIYYTTSNIVHIEPTINHPAQVIHPFKIFDCFGADLVLGLPETDEGYNGILIITPRLFNIYVIIAGSKMRQLLTIHAQNVLTRTA
jgi:hypothetical protein